MIFLHIGYHKTGTTWLQKHFFPKHSSFVMPFSGEEIRQQIVYPNFFSFNHKLAMNFFMPQIRLAEKSGKIVILSTERLCGSPFAGGYDSAEIARRLQQTFPNAKIWIVIRNQIDIIASTYRNYVSSGGTATLSRFIRGQSPERFPFFSLSHFEYHHLIHLYQDLFGHANVLVSLYEDFKSSPAVYFSSLDKFLGISTDINKFPLSDIVYRGRSDISALLKRHLNVFEYNTSMLKFPVYKLNQGFLVNKMFGALDKLIFSHLNRKIIKPRLNMLIGNYYLDSNLIMEKMLECDLASKGYQVQSIKRLSVKE